MKIDKEKPLPDHTKLDYDECCAFLVLCELFPDRYKNMEIKDKPDLQSENIGIEVTIADDRKHQEALNNWVKANSCDDVTKKEKYIERMMQLGVKYSGWIQTWGNYTPSFKYVYEAINNKIHKIKKGNYKRFLNNELFVFTDAWIRDHVIEEAKVFFADNSVFDYYQRLYILEKGYKLFIFERNSFQLVIIDTTEQSERNIRAREMVEQAESEE